jgi:tetratricopeptide (TPR) repeat protein
MCLEWKEAIEQLENIIDSTGKRKAFEFNSICTLQLACAYQMVGDHQKAMEHLKKVKQYVSNKGRFDKMALRKADSILASNDPASAMTSSAFEILYFKRDIAHMQKEHLEKVEEHISKLCLLGFDPQKDLKKTKPDDVMNIASNLVIAGAIQSLLGQKDKAREMWDKVIQSEAGMPSNGKHWIVGALYELAEMSFREGKLEDSQDYIVKACKYSNYDWEDVYKSRLNKARSQLKKALLNKGLKVVEKIETTEVVNQDEETDDATLSEKEKLQQQQQGDHGSGSGSGTVVDNGHK